jgi:hypothetical protein
MKLLACCVVLIVALHGVCLGRCDGGNAAGRTPSSNAPPCHQSQDEEGPSSSHHQNASSTCGEGPILGGKGGNGSKGATGGQDLSFPIAESLPAAWAAPIPPGVWTTPTIRDLVQSPRPPLQSSVLRI